MKSYIGIFRYMNLEKTLTVLNNPMRRKIISWLKDRSNFPPALPEHVNVKGVCVGYIRDKTGLSQSTVSNYMGLLKDVGLVDSERHGQWTFYSRNEDAISAFVTAIEEELCKKQ